MDTMMVETKYNELQAMFHMFASKWEYRPILDYEEILSLCDLGFVQALKSYEKGSTKFSTWVYTICEGLIFDAIKKHVKRTRLSLTDISERLEAKHSSKPLDERLRDVSRDASFVLSHLIDTETSVILKDIRVCQRQPRLLRKRLLRCLEMRGWDTNRISNVWEEIQTCL